MKSMIPVWVVVVDKSTKNYPLYVKNINTDHRLVWSYFHDADPGFERVVKDILGISSDSPVVFNAYCDYLIHPITGEVLSGDGETLGQFIRKSHERHVELVRSAGDLMIVAAGV